VVVVSVVLVVLVVLVVSVGPVGVQVPAAGAADVNARPRSIQVIRVV
jgi:hypothetical protein